MTTDADFACHYVDLFREVASNGRITRLIHCAFRQYQECKSGMYRLVACMNSLTDNHFRLLYQTIVEIVNNLFTILMRPVHDRGLPNVP